MKRLLAAATLALGATCALGQGLVPNGGPAESALQLARGLGSAMSALPEMQRACQHTAEQKRRVARVVAYLEEQMTRAAGPDAGSAYRAALQAGAANARATLAATPQATLATACVQMNQSFAAELERAEREIPESWQPPARGLAGEAASSPRRKKH